MWIVATKHDSEARFRAIHEYVLSHLTPFGDDFWTTPIANEAEKRGNHNEGLRGQAARWPTPQAADDRDRGNLNDPCIQRRIASGKQVMLTMVVKGGDGDGRAVWPTPHTNCHTWVGTSGRDGGENLQTAAGGSLSPAFVETLMGYPIGYTLPEGEAMRDLPNVWPADSPDGRGWMTPKKGDGEFASGSTSGRPREMSTHHLATQVKLTQTWPAGLGAPQHPWEPPRLTTEKRHRADRLKALGNSIVPQVAALIFQAIALADAGASSCKEQA